MPSEVTSYFDAIRRNRIARRLMRQLQGLWTQRIPNHKRSFMTHPCCDFAENLRQPKNQQIITATLPQNSVSQTMRRNRDRSTSIDTFRFMGHLLGYARVSTVQQKQAKRDPFSCLLSHPNAYE